jgi:hypothetical protein
LRKSLFILITICALSAITLISASVLFSFSLNMIATAAPQGSVKITIDATDYTNGAPITINWGTVQWGANSKTITITNNVNLALTPSIRASPSLPTGWTLTLSLSQPIAAGGSATGTLTLNVPTDTAAGSYSSMSAIIDVSYS